MTDIGSKYSNFEPGFVALAAHGLQLLAKPILHAVRTVQDADHRVSPVTGRFLTKGMKVSDRSAGHPAIKLLRSDPPDVLVVANAMEFSAHERPHDARPAASGLVSRLLWSEKLGHI